MNGKPVFSDHSVSLEITSRALSNPQRDILIPCFDLDNDNAQTAAGIKEFDLVFAEFCNGQSDSTEAFATQIRDVPDEFNDLPYEEMNELSSGHTPTYLDSPDPSQHELFTFLDCDLPAAGGTGTVSYEKDEKVVDVKEYRDLTVEGLIEKYVDKENNVNNALTRNETLVSLRRSSRKRKLSSIDSDAALTNVDQGMSLAEPKVPRCGPGRKKESRQKRVDRVAAANREVKKSKSLITLGKNVELKIHSNFERFATESPLRN